ncbi:hypothetical protein [Nesterenkonia pannonica]|uniref:hypothetical protein n=1 Tax=Nesterenkonia pannonica TaxID=1548602 RepID=UPI002164E918|nr:hypothetical protein [Nesterenkonia pannonica]
MAAQQGGGAPLLVDAELLGDLRPAHPCAVPGHTHLLGGFLLAHKWFHSDCLLEG